MERTFLFIRRCVVLTAAMCFCISGLSAQNLNKYRKDCKINSIDDKYGIVFQGKQTVAPRYEEIVPLNEYTFRVKENNKYGLLGVGFAKRKDLIGGGWRLLAVEKAEGSEHCIFFFISESSVYDRIELARDNSIEIYKGQNKGLVNKYGDKLIPCKYEEITREEDIYYVSQGKQLGVFNRYGEVIVPCSYTGISRVKDVFYVRKGEEQGIINRYGETIVPCCYAEILQEGEMYQVSQHGKYGIINRYGKVIVPCRYDQLTNIKTNYLVKKGHLYGVYNQYGKALLSCTFDAIDFLRDGKFLAKKGGKKELYNAYGTFIADCSEGSVFYSTSGGKQEAE